MTLVPIKIDEDLQDENSKLRALISNNFGRRKNNPAKDRKALETYVSLRGYKQGGTGSNQYMQTCQNGTSAKSTLDEIAKEFNMSKRNLQRALRIERNLTDSMKELLDTGKITKTFASDNALYAVIILLMHNLTVLDSNNAIQSDFISLENNILLRIIKCRFWDFCYIFAIGFIKAIYYDRYYIDYDWRNLRWKKTKGKQL